MQDSALNISCFQWFNGIRANRIIFWPYLEKAIKKLAFQSKLHENTIRGYLYSKFSFGEAYSLIYGWKFSFTVTCQ